MYVYMDVLSSHNVQQGEYHFFESVLLVLSRSSRYHFALVFAVFTLHSFFLVLNDGPVHGSRTHSPRWLDTFGTGIHAHLIAYTTCRSCYCTIRW